MCTPASPEACAASVPARPLLPCQPERKMNARITVARGGAGAFSTRPNASRMPGQTRRTASSSAGTNPLIESLGGIMLRSPRGESARWPRKLVVGAQLVPTSTHHYRANRRLWFGQAQGFARSQRRKEQAVASAISSLARSFESREEGVATDAGGLSEQGGHGRGRRLPRPRCARLTRHDLSHQKPANKGASRSAHLATHFSCTPSTS